MKWFYEANGKPQGPVSTAEMDRLVAAGEVTPKTQVWRDGMKDWQLLYEARPELNPNAARCADCGCVLEKDEGRTVGEALYCDRCALDAEEALARSLPPPLPEGWEEAGRSGPAWEHRETRGIFHTAKETVKEVLGEPGRTFRNMRCEGGLVVPLAFAVIAGSVGEAANSLYRWLVAQFASFSAYPPQMAETMERMMVPYKSPLVMFQSIVLAPVVITTSVVVASLVLHVLLLVVGTQTRSFETTFRVVAYAWGAAMVLMVVPAIGGLLALGWGAVAIIIGLASAHETTRWQSAVAVSLPILGIAAVLIMGVVLLLTGQVPS